MFGLDTRVIFAAILDDCDKWIHSAIPYLSCCCSDRIGGVCACSRHSSWLPYVCVARGVLQSPRGWRLNFLRASFFSCHSFSPNHACASLSQSFVSSRATVSSVMDGYIVPFRVRGYCWWNLQFRNSAKLAPQKLSLIHI